jgi:hypothetical protein
VHRGYARSPGFGLSSTPDPALQRKARLLGRFDSLISITEGAPRHADRRTTEPYSNGNENGAGTLDQFSGELRLDPVTVQSACDPMTEPPYMHLDVRAWQDFKRNTPARGSTSIPPVVLAATLLVLWFKNARLGPLTVSQAQAVLNTIDTRDKNPARALRNCSWLQTRDDVVKLNPARFDQAVAVARAYCSHRPIEE